MATSAINTDITKIIQTEGGFSNDPTDPGGRTFEGIDERSNPDAWKNGQPTPEQVRAIYLSKYVQGPGFDKIPNVKLQFQLIDFGVNSGPSVAISKLQSILQVPVDGVLGPQTLDALTKADPTPVNNQLVIARIKMIAGIVARNPSQVKFLVGWVNRASEFLV